MEPTRTQLSPEDGSTQPDEKRKGRRAIVTAIAADLYRLSKTSRGDIAELRRMSHDNPGSPAFWKLAALRLDENLSDADVKRWSTIVAAMAATADIPGQRLPLGKALATAGVAEPRVLRLLRARGDALLDAVRVTARQLSSAAVVADWADIARLVFNDSGPKGEQIRRKIAASYYRNAKTSTEESRKEN